MRELDQLALTGDTRSRIAGLDAADRQQLQRLIADAQAQQERSLQQATDTALKHVPALLRGPIRRILGL